MEWDIRVEILQIHLFGTIIFVFHFNPGNWDPWLLTFRSKKQLIMVLFIFLGFWMPRKTSLKKKKKIAAHLLVVEQPLPLMGTHCCRARYCHCSTRRVDPVKLPLFPKICGCNPRNTTSLPQTSLLQSSHDAIEQPWATTTCEVPT